MTRDKVDCEMPVVSASARWLSPAAARARSILTPTLVVITTTSNVTESRSPYVIQCTEEVDKHIHAMIAVASASSRADARD